MYDPIYRGKKKKKNFLPFSHVCMLKILSILKKKKNYRKMDYQKIYRRM